MSRRSVLLDSPPICSPPSDPHLIPFAPSPPILPPAHSPACRPPPVDSPASRPLPGSSNVPDPPWSASELLHAGHGGDDSLASVGGRSGDLLPYALLHDGGASIWAPSRSPPPTCSQTGLRTRTLAYAAACSTAASVGSTLKRVNKCLQNACSASNIPFCEFFRDCGSGFDIGGQTWLNRQQWYNDSVSTACFNTGDGHTFQYGIYQGAVLLATKRSVVTRYIYSLFWGFQQISNLAGNLVPSYFEGEVLFTMAIVGLGLLHFALLIGNMQNFMMTSHGFAKLVAKVLACLHHGNRPSDAKHIRTMNYTNISVDHKEAANSLVIKRSLKTGDSLLRHSSMQKQLM